MMSFGGRLRGNRNRQQDHEPLKGKSASERVSERTSETRLKTSENLSENL